MRFEPTISRTVTKSLLLYRLRYRDSICLATSNIIKVLKMSSKVCKMSPCRETMRNRAQEGESDTKTQGQEKKTSVIDY